MNVTSNPTQIHSRSRQMVDATEDKFFKELERTLQTQAEQWASLPRPQNIGMFCENPLCKYYTHGHKNSATIEVRADESCLKTKLVKRCPYQLTVDTEKGFSLFLCEDCIREAESYEFLQTLYDVLSDNNAFAGKTRTAGLKIGSGK